jgi:hypothetical protein
LTHRVGTPGGFPVPASPADDLEILMMKHSRKLALGALAAVASGLAIAVAVAHPGGMQHGGPMGMMGMMHSGDAAFQADMQLVHEMLAGHEKLKRTVENLPDGIRTVTESDDPQVAQALKAHVASMEQRLKDGRIFNLFSPTLPVLFENKDKITTTVEMTSNGAIVKQTSADAQVVAALQAHAGEVGELARDGMAAMMRGMRSRMMGALR